MACCLASISPSVVGRAEEDLWVGVAWTRKAPGLPSPPLWGLSLGIGVRCPCHLLLPQGSSLGHSHLLLEGVCLLIFSLHPCVSLSLSLSLFLPRVFLHVSASISISFPLSPYLFVSPILSVPLCLSPAISSGSFLSPSLFLSLPCIPLSLLSPLPPMDPAHLSEIDPSCLSLKSSQR